MALVGPHKLISILGDFMSAWNNRKKVNTEDANYEKEEIKWFCSF